MALITVSHLKKYFEVPQKEPGFFGGLTSLLGRRFRQVKALDDISFQIDEGELVGFIGPNGAGKTTALKILSGLLYPTAGEISVLGFQPFERREKFQKQFALLMGQKNQLWWDLPAYDSFLLSKEIYEIGEVVFRERVERLTKMLQIEEVLKIPVRKLSLGQRMKAELVVALLHQPKVLFLDEPTIGLDVVAQKKMRDFIKNYNQEFASTIILTSHYMGDVKELCERVIIIDRGRIVFDGRLSQVVDRFVDHKVIKLDFEQEVDKGRLNRYGEVIQYGKLFASVQVERKKVADVAAKLLGNFPVADLTIEEPPIEEIIRELFVKGEYEKGDS